MSFPAMDWAMRIPGLSGNERAVLICITWRLNQKTGQCNPSVESIRETMGIGRDQVRKAIKSLTEKGLIRREGSQGCILNFVVNFSGEFSSADSDSLTEENTTTQMSTPTRSSTPTEMSTPAQSSSTPLLNQVGDPYSIEYPNKEGNKEENKEYLSSEKSVDEINDLFSESGTQEIEPEKVSIKKTVTWQSRVRAEDVMNLYNEILGNTLPALRLLNSNRRTLIKSRLNDLVELWHAGNEDEGLDSFKVFFTKVRSSDFLCGRSERGRGHENFKANFDWIMQQKNFTKIIEGNYK